MAIANSKLIEFITEARKRGYDNYHIRQPLLEEGWTPEEIEEGFFFADKKRTNRSQNKGLKSKVEIYLDSEVLKIIEKRAKKNMLSVPEQIEDIVRRSCVRSKFILPSQEKLDDLLVSIFSRRKSGRK